MNVVEMAGSSNRDQELRSRAGMSTPTFSASGIPSAPKNSMDSGPSPNAFDATNSKISSDTFKSSGDTDRYGNDLSLTNRYNQGAEMLRKMRGESSLPKPEMQNGMGQMGQMFSAMGSMMSGNPIDAKMAEKNPFLKFFMGQTGMGSSTLNPGDPTRNQNDPFQVTSAARNLF